MAEQQQTNTEAVEAGDELVETALSEMAESMGMPVADLERAFRRLAQHLTDNEEAIRRAYEAISDAGQHPRGKAAQHSPYDIGGKP